MKRYLFSTLFAAIFLPAAHAGAETENAPVPEIFLYKGITLIQEGKHEEGVAALKRAAKAEHADALYNLALCSLQGIGIRKSERNAFKLFHMAADRGCAEAKYNLGLCYAEGVGVKQNLAKAVQWWQQAADEGIRDAMLNLSVCYSKGLGVPQDEARAQALLDAARAAESSPPAQP